MSREGHPYRKSIIYTKLYHTTSYGDVDRFGKPTRHLTRYGGFRGLGGICHFDMPRYTELPPKCQFDISAHTRGSPKCQFDILPHIWLAAKCQIDILVMGWCFPQCHCFTVGESMVGRSHGIVIYYIRICIVSRCRVPLRPVA